MTDSQVLSAVIESLEKYNEDRNESLINFLCEKLNFTIAATMDEDIYQVH